MKSIEKPLFFILDDSTPVAPKILADLKAEQGKVLLHHFPDGETYVRIDSDIKDRDIIIINSLDYPDSKIMALLLFIDTAKDLGAKSIGLVAPYLAYMRQDKRFKEGEGITSRYFANILSRHIDWLMTMDPHLHRYKDLNEIYTIPSFLLHAIENISAWIKNHIENPVLIGPDKESKQWVESIALKNQMPYLILEKKRLGDKSVEIKIPDIQNYETCTPVLVDDIISTGKTMLAATKVLAQLGLPPPVCIGVHAIFAENAYEALSKVPDIKIITCNTIKHISNEIDVSGRFVAQLRSLGCK